MGYSPFTSPMESFPFPTDLKNWIFSPIMISSRYSLSISKTFTHASNDKRLIGEPAEGRLANLLFFQSLCHCDAFRKKSLAISISDFL
jgi:hypothetical protein